MQTNFLRDVVTELLSFSVFSKVVTQMNEVILASLFTSIVLRAVVGVNNR